MTQDEFRKEQLQYIKSLPVRTVSVGEKREKIACDFEKKIAYFLDGNGFPTGKATRLNDENASKLFRSEDSEQHEKNSMGTSQGTKAVKRKKSLLYSLRRLAGASDDELTSTSDTFSKGDELGQKKSKKKKIIFTVTIVCVATVVTAYYYMTSTTTEAPETTKNNDISSLAEIDVIQVTDELIPGDQITQENIQQVSISAEVYNQISLSSVNLYQWSRSESLIGAYAVKYIPRGQYLTYENVNSVYEPTTNPWSSVGDGYTLLTLPIKDNDIDVNYGSVLSLTIEKKTVQETGSRDPEAEESPAVEGLEHKTSVEQSSIVDTYGLSNVVVCDLLNSDENSIYNTLTTWMAIPAGEQEPYIKSQFKENKELIKNLQPKYVRIRVTDAQAKALGSLTEGNISVKITVQDKSDTGNDAKRQYASESKALMKTINSLIEEVDADKGGEDSE